MQMVLYYLITQPGVGVIKLYCIHSHEIDLQMQLTQVCFRHLVVYTLLIASREMHELQVYVHTLL